MLFLTIAFLWLMSGVISLGVLPTQHMGDALLTILGGPLGLICWIFGVFFFANGKG
jgi:hypothetical protein